MLGLYCPSHRFSSVTNISRQKSEIAVWLQSGGFSNLLRGSGADASARRHECFSAGKSQQGHKVSTLARVKTLPGDSCHHTQKTGLCTCNIPPCSVCYPSISIWAEPLKKYPALTLNPATLTGRGKRNREEFGEQWTVLKRSLGSPWNTSFSSASRTNNINFDISASIYTHFFFGNHTIAGKRNSLV